MIAIKDYYHQRKVIAWVKDKATAMLYINFKGWMIHHRDKQGDYIVFASLIKGVDRITT